MSTYVTRPTSACERVSRELSVLLSELHFPTRALGPITEARDLLLGATLDANEFYATERDELVRDVVQLRADLAAAIAECKRLRKCMDGEIQERNELRARLAAIDAQPDVAICYRGKEQGWARLIGDTWPTGALIARPAKD